MRARIRSKLKSLLGLDKKTADWEYFIREDDPYIKRGTAMVRPDEILSGQRKVYLGCDVFNPSMPLHKYHGSVAWFYEGEIATILTHETLHVVVGYMEGRKAGKGIDLIDRWESISAI